MKCDTAQCSDLVNADDMQGSIMLHWEMDSLCLTASEAAKCAQEAVSIFSFSICFSRFFHSMLSQSKHLIHHQAMHRQCAGFSVRFPFHEQNTYNEI